MDQKKTRQPLRLTDIFSSQMLLTHQNSSLYDGENVNVSNASLLFKEDGNPFVSNLTKRLAAAMQQHSSKQNKWLRQIEKITAVRNEDNLYATRTKRNLNKSLRSSSIGSLIERQERFKYDEMGSKEPSQWWRHKSPERDTEKPADLQNRVNGFYASVRGSDVAYVTMNAKNTNTMLWSTSPTNRTKRGESMKKDIAVLPTVRRKSKIFRGYNKTMEPAAYVFAAKAPVE